MAGFKFCIGVISNNLDKIHYLYILKTFQCLQYLMIGMLI
jgi:hypothetical protein